jgi:hypothetical protein
MGNISKITKSEITKNRFLTVECGVDTTTKIMNVYMKEALYILLTVDVFMVTGKIYDDGKDGKFLIAQREYMISALNFMTSKDHKLGGMFGLSIADVPNPMFLVFGWLRPLRDSLKEKKMYPAKVVDGVRVAMNMDDEAEAGYIECYAPLPPLQRTMMVIAYPILVRWLMQSVLNVGQKLI